MTTPRLALAALIAVATLVSGCASSPGATGSPTAVAPRPSATPTPTPTPTPEPVQARVPFDGDCDRILAPGALVDYFGGAEPTVRALDGIRGVMPDVAGSLAQLGGLACAWTTETPRIRHVVVVVVPVAAVPAELVDAYAEYTCSSLPACGRAETRSGMWVLAETPPLQYRDEPSAEETQLLTATIDTVIGSVVGHGSEEFAGVPAALAPGVWDLPPCDAFESAVAGAAGMDAPQPGFPTDNVPDGSVWAIITAAELAQWCPWWDYSSGEARMAEIHLLSGIGAPSDAQLAAAETTPITVAGADAAWTFPDHQGVGRSIEVLVVVGQNRLLAAGVDAEAVAAAALQVLAE